MNIRFLALRRAHTVYYRGTEITDRHSITCRIKTQCIYYTASEISEWCSGEMSPSIEDVSE